MSKKNMMRREERRKELAAKYFERRKELRGIINDPETSLEDKEAAYKAISKMPKDSAKVRSRNRCQLTGRPRGVYRKVGLCRHEFLRIFRIGGFPGFRKASW